MTLFLTADRPATAGRIGFIGFGAIAREVAALLDCANARRECVALVRDPSRTQDHPGVTTVGSLEQLLHAAPDVVVEAAGHEAVSTLVPGVLARRIPVVLASVGALADEQTMRRLLESCSNGGRLCIPSGAIGGLDYLAALRKVPDASVTYTSRKAPAAWATELQALRIDPGTLMVEQVLFEGGAGEAAAKFPRNLNVAMTIAIAGTGVRRTRVRVVADPRVRENTHEIVAQSALGTAEFVFRNNSFAHNPRTSQVTAHSVAASALEALEICRQRGKTT